MLRTSLILIHIVCLVGWLFGTFVGWLVGCLLEVSWAFVYTVTPASGRRPSVCQHFQTTAGKNFKLHIETPEDAGTKICLNGPGHMTKIAAMPIYG